MYHSRYPSSFDGHPFKDSTKTIPSVSDKGYRTPQLPGTGQPDTGGWAKAHCCLVVMTLKKNNVFVNVTNLKGQVSVIKFSSGLIQKKKSKKTSQTAAKWMIEKVLLVVKNNLFDCVKMVIKGHTSKSVAYLRDFARGAKRKKIKIISFQNFVPIAHNGCRPPKKRRI
jgi:ribosomal protein S11